MGWNSRNGRPQPPPGERQPGVNNKNKCKYCGGFGGHVDRSNEPAEWHDCKYCKGTGKS